MYDGTRFIRNFAPERCSAPKAANGMAKHKLVRAAILSRPRGLGDIVFRGQQANHKQRQDGGGHREGGARKFKKCGEKSWLHGPTDRYSASNSTTELVQGHTFRASGEAIRGSNIARANTLQTTRRFWRYCRQTRSNSVPSCLSVAREKSGC